MDKVIRPWICREPFTPNRRKRKKRKKLITELQMKGSSQKEKMVFLLNYDKQEEVKEIPIMIHANQSSLIDDA